MRKGKGRWAPPPGKEGHTLALVLQDENPARAFLCFSKGQIWASGYDANSKTDEACYGAEGRLSRCLSPRGCHPVRLPWRDDADHFSDVDRLIVTDGETDG